jgi:flagellar biosynthesis anti-sigma factor FlgM
MSTTKIDSASPNPVGAAGASAPVRPVAKAARDATTAATVGHAAKLGQDSVELTGEARVMQELEQRVQSESGVDEAKVAEMRRILAQGLYTADPALIAGRLMQLEWSISRGR